MNRRTATLCGFTAVAMWSLLALFTAASGHVPPFQLAAMTFLVGGVIGLAWLSITSRWRDLVQPAPVWVLGVVGLFGYHALYFAALRNAPPVEAGLIAYLWPLLIVVFSALLPGERLRWYHLAGAAFGLAGTALIVARDGSVSFESQYMSGYVAALACALTWSIYSVASRRFASVPTGIVAGFCMVTAVFSCLAHLVFETTVWPSDTGQWLAVFGLGLMPVGAAFYVWDVGVKRGDIQFLGVASYAAPLFSTLILIVFGFGQFTVKVGIAAILISAGALVASMPTLVSKPKIPGKVS